MWSVDFRQLMILLRSIHSYIWFSILYHWCRRLRLGLEMTLSQFWWTFEKELWYQSYRMQLSSKLLRLRQLPSLALSNIPTSLKLYQWKYLLGVLSLLLPPNCCACRFEAISFKMKSFNMLSNNFENHWCQIFSLVQKKFGKRNFWYRGNYFHFP